MRTPARSVFASCLNDNVTVKATEHANSGSSSGTVMHQHATLQGKEIRRKRGGRAGRAPAGAADAFHWSDDISLDSIGSGWREANKAGDRVARLAEVFRWVGPPHSVRIESEIMLHDIIGRDEGRGGGGVGADGWGGGDVDGCATSAPAGTADNFVHMWEVRNPHIANRRVTVQQRIHNSPTFKGTGETVASERFGGNVVPTPFRDTAVQG